MFCFLLIFLDSGIEMYGKLLAGLLQVRVYMVIFIFYVEICPCTMGTSLLIVFTCQLIKLP
jgi:hypothetical protein